jgi:hypothetical protein
VDPSPGAGFAATSPTYWAQPQSMWPSPRPPERMTQSGGDDTLVEWCSAVACLTPASHRVNQPQRALKSTLARLLATMSSNRLSRAFFFERLARVQWASRPSRELVPLKVGEVPALIFTVQMQLAAASQF